MITFSLEVDGAPVMAPEVRDRISAVTSARQQVQHTGTVGVGAHLAYTQMHIVDDDKTTEGVGVMKYNYEVWFNVL